MSADLPLVLISDASAEAERLAQVLRTEGLTVADVPLAMLFARASLQRPNIVILDADAEDALETVGRIRELPGGEGIHFVLLGTTTDEAEDVPTFSRPVDINAVRDRVRQLIAHGRSSPPRKAGPSQPPSLRSVPLPAPSVPSMAPPPPPSLRGLYEPVSPELARVLVDAENRVAALSFESLPPSPEEELDAVLPEEYLQSLDVPIDAVEEELQENLASAHSRATTTGGSGRQTTGGSTSDPTTGSQARLDGTQPPLPSIKSTMRMLQESEPQVTVAHRMRPTSEAEVRRPSTFLEPISPTESLGTDPPAAALPTESPPRLLPTLKHLGRHDAARSLARAIAARVTGSLCFSSRDPQGIRRILLRDGDLVLATSGLETESLVAFLVARGELAPDRMDLAHTLPPFGKRAIAPLIAKGLLARDQMWNVLRAHAEWILGQVLTLAEGTLAQEAEVPATLRDEDSVFGGSTGAEVFVDVLRRAVGPEEAIDWIGGQKARIADGPNRALSSELKGPTIAFVDFACGKSLEQALEGQEPSLVSVVWALSLLGIVSLGGEGEPGAEVARHDTHPPEPAIEILDQEAVRERIQARLALIENGDYFAILGVPRNATSYEIRRAYVDLRRNFESTRSQVPEADLLGDVERIVSVLEEAHDILSDDARRARYRQAIEASPIH